MYNSTLLIASVAREEIVGFYSTGPKMKENDLKVCLWHLSLILMMRAD